VDWYRCVTDALSSVGLVVNHDKSFVHGHFRESCGMDAFRGVQVTPIRFRKPLPTVRPNVIVHEDVDGGVKVVPKRIDPETLESAVGFANQMAMNGYQEVRDVIELYLSTVWDCEVPYGLVDSSYVAWIESYATAIRLNKARGWKLRYDVRHGAVFVDKAPFTKRSSDPTRVADWPRLLRDICQGAGPDPDHVVDPRSTKIKRGWRRLG
jgi:hypothetical protein